MNTTSNTAAAATGDNSAHRLDKIKSQLGLLGKAEAMGSGSRRDAGLALCAGAMAGDIAEADAATLYDEYVSNLGRVASKKHLAGVGNAGSYKAQVSKFRTFIKMGSLAVDGSAVLDRAIIQAETVAAAGDKVLSPFDALKAVCVAQIAQPTVVLTDEQIRAAVSKAEAEEKDELARLVAAYKAAHKLNADLGLAGTASALAAYGDAITELGGDIPAVSKEEKKLAAFMEQAAAMGFVAAPAAQ